MSELDQVRRQLATANARVAALEQALKEHSGYPSIAANLDSARRVRKKLELQLEQAAAAIGVEVAKLADTPAAPAS
jgi:acetate kinase